tara:strand:- start:98 stop:475 length:378 start_codon:yes stop_codon:yes gene_type:complete
MGFFGPSKEEQAAAEAEAQAQLEKANLVKITTGDIDKKYEILKIVFQLGSDKGGTWGQLLGTGGSPEAAFSHAETQLKIKAADLGCDYVINAVFNQRVAVGGKSITGDYNQVIEVFAYGTAVKTK